MNYMIKKYTQLSGAVIAATISAGTMTYAETGTWKQNWGNTVGEKLTEELAQLCPVVDPGDEQAYEACRVGGRGASIINDNLAEYIIWGGGEIKPTFDDRKLTQFGKTAWSTLYLPLFVFTGNSTTEFDEEAQVMRLRVEARFRNLLEPGQYLYPFWHASEKWQAYQEANELVFTLDLRGARVIGIQRTPFGNANPELDAKLGLSMVDAPRDFNKNEWMWADDSGTLQPKVTLFDSMFDASNPHIADVDSSYLVFADQLREQTCMDCHVPDNPEKWEISYSCRHLLMPQVKLTGLFGPFLTGLCLWNPGPVPKVSPTRRS